MHESVNTKQLRSRLGSYLTQVEKGLTLVVIRQGQAVAELRPYGMEQAQNGHPEPDAAPPVAPPPTPTRMSALGLTAYQYNLDNLDEEPTPAAPAPDQADQNGQVSPLEAEGSDPPSQALPGNRSRSHQSPAATSKGQPRRRTGARKKSA